MSAHINLKTVAITKEFNFLVVINFGNNFIKKFTLLYLRTNAFILIQTQLRKSEQHHYEITDKWFFSWKQS